MRNLKRALSLALASVMVLGMMVVGTSASYADVADTDNVEAIEVVKAVGIMVGDDKGNFNPDQKVTRNEMAVVMANLLKLNVSDFKGANVPFTDVPEWAKPYVAACYADGIIAGTSATTFSGDASVTAAQAGLMMMKALGYFQFQEDFGDDWQLATVKQASKIELYDGINSAANAALTRNEVAQLALNTLEADVVDYSGDQGTDIKTSDGTTIKVGYTIKYDQYFSTSYNYNHAASGSTDLARQQLCEKLYKGDIDKTHSSDNFGRPASIWSYKNDTIGKYADEADKVYTAGVKVKDLYKALDLSGTTTFNVEVDGNTTTTVSIDNTTSTNIPGTGNGIITEVYYDKTVSPIVAKITIINPVVDEISTVVEKKDEDRLVKIGSKEYKTEGFAEGDIVVYTQDANAGNADKIQTMTAVEKLTGDVTKKVGTTEVYIDGTQYKLSASTGANLASVNVKDTVDYYLDSNGYIIKLAISSSNVTVDDLAYVEAAGSTRGDWATLRLADGTKMTVDTKENYSSLARHIVTFKETKDGYELKDKSNALQTSAQPNTFTKGNPTLTLVGLNAATVKTDSKTVFLYKTTGTETEYTSYTGFKNAPGLKALANSQITFYRESASKPALLVFIEVAKTDLAITSSDMTFVAYDSDVKYVDDGDSTVYYEYNAIVDGKITTVKVDSTVQASVAGAGADIIAPFKGLSRDSYDVATGTTSATLNTDFFKATTSEAEKNEMIGLDSGWFAYTDDVKVFVVDTDQNINAGTISSLKKDDGTTKDPYQAIFYTKDSDGKVDLMILVEK